MDMAFEFGIETFGEVPVDDAGTPVSYGQALRQVVEEAKLADELGIDVIALGEHHRDDYAISSPEMVLSAAASVTDTIKLGTAVTVLSSDDPVRLFERFATLDGVSNGRAQIMLGRGSFTESFPLFGFDLRDYNKLFDEKIALWDELLEEEPVMWDRGGRVLNEADVFPKTESGRIETWVGVGGSPESVIRAAKYEFPLMLAIIGGEASRFKPFADLYRAALEQLGKEPQRVGVHSHGFIQKDAKDAKEIYFPGFKKGRDRIGAERGWAGLSRGQYEHEVKHGSLYIGNPEQVAEKIVATVRALDLDRFDFTYSGSQSLTGKARLESIELFGTEVIPLVRKELGDE